MRGDRSGTSRPRGAEWTASSSRAWPASWRIAVLVAVAPRTLAFERSLVAQEAVERTAASNPTAALARARQAVDLQPDSALAVDQTMVLADRTGDSAAAISAAASATGRTRRARSAPGRARHPPRRSGQHDSAVAESEGRPRPRWGGSVRPAERCGPALGRRRPRRRPGGARTPRGGTAVHRSPGSGAAAGRRGVCCRRRRRKRSPTWRRLGEWSDALAAALTGDPSRRRCGRGGGAGRPTGVVGPGARRMGRQRAGAVSPGDVASRGSHRRDHDEMGVAPRGPTLQHPRSQPLAKCPADLRRRTVQCSGGHRRSPTGPVDAPSRLPDLPLPRRHPRGSVRGGNVDIPRRVARVRRQMTARTAIATRSTCVSDMPGQIGRLTAPA